MAPHRYADVHALGYGLVVLVERRVSLRKEVQNGGMNDNVRCPGRLRMPRQLDHGVHVLVRTGSNQAGLFANLVHGDFDETLALGERHREKLALFAADENPVDAEFVDPVAQVSPKGWLVNCQVIRERHECGCPDAPHVGARVGFGVLPGIEFQF